MCICFFFNFVAVNMAAKLALLLMTVVGAIIIYATVAVFVVGLTPLAVLGKWAVVAGVGIGIAAALDTLGAVAGARSAAETVAFTCIIALILVAVSVVRFTNGSVASRADVAGSLAVVGSSTVAGRTVATVAVRSSYVCGYNEVALRRLFRKNILMLLWRCLT